MESIIKSILQTAGAKKECKRVGRGSASGYGRTAGRGHEGQRSRGNIRVSHLIKQALKVRKIRKKAGINKILYADYEITANSLSKDLLNILNKCENPQSILVEIAKYYQFTYDNNTIVKHLCQIFNIPHYIKTINIIGFGSNNIKLHI